MALGSVPPYTPPTIVKGRIKIEDFVADVTSVSVSRRTNGDTVCEVTVMSLGQEISDYISRVIPLILLKSPTFKMKFRNSVISSWQTSFTSQGLTLDIEFQARGIEIMEVK